MMSLTRCKHVLRNTVNISNQYVLDQLASKCSVSTYNCMNKNNKTILFKHNNSQPIHESKRYLNLQEYQSKELMHNHGINIQPFRIANNTEEANKIVKEFVHPEYVIKAQILAGGRGKGTFSNGFKGGVHLTKSPTEVGNLVGKMINQHLITKQTGDEGVLVNKVMVAEALDIDRETYLAILMDREFGGPVIVGSPRGGMNIEEVASEDPNALLKVYVDIFEGLTHEKAAEMIEFLHFKPGTEQFQIACDQLKRLYDLFCHQDCTQVEINPFAETPDGRVVCFDAKFEFDDNSEFRHRELFASEDKSGQDPREAEANRCNLNYVGLDGNIGCLVNGAGLAMATMDMIQLYGGMPANFLDVGGSVSEQQVRQAFQLISSDPKVKCIFVNIFGGIVDCETIAKGIVGACKSIQLKVPLVVRLQGTNVENARKYISQSGISIISCDDFSEAAEQAVACLQSS